MDVNFILVTVFNGRFFMNQVKTNKISKYALSLIAVAALSCSSLSFGMDIFQAIEKKDIKRAEEILKDKSFDVNKADKDGRTPLYWACYKNYPEIVKLLLDKGAEKSVNIADNYGWTPLNWACYINNLELVTLLLASGADVDQKSLNKAQGKPEILKLLKERSSIKK